MRNNVGFEVFIVFLRLLYLTIFRRGKAGMKMNGTGF